MQHQFVQQNVDNTSMTVWPFFVAQAVWTETKTRHIWVSSKTKRKTEGFLFAGGGANLKKTRLPYECGCGSEIGTQNGTLVNGNKG